MCAAIAGELPAKCGADAPALAPHTATADAARVVTEDRAVDRQRLGQEAETRAVQLLERAGFIVLMRNYRCRAGELDIIARRAGLLVIAEVRLRTRADFGGAAASITAAKRRRMVRAARWLLRQRPALAGLAVRFDALVMSAVEGPIEWIEAAFEAG